MMAAEITARSVYRAVHASGNQAPGGCQNGLSSARYQLDFVVVAIAPDRAQAAVGRR